MADGDTRINDYRRYTKNQDIHKENQILPAPPSFYPCTLNISPAPVHLHHSTKSLAPTEQRQAVEECTTLELGLDLMQ